MTAQRELMPAPGLVWGPYPQRDAGVPVSDPVRYMTRLTRRARGRCAGWTDPLDRIGNQRFARRVLRMTRRLARLDDAELRTRVQTQRALLGRYGLTDKHLTRTLALVAETSRRATGQLPYQTQIVACRILLSNRLAEMATGEGKTLATGLAAAAAALAGTPVHVLTANDYLVERDRNAMQPLFDALGLSSASILPGMALEQRAGNYACDVVYATAKELVFDYLRDRIALSMDDAELNWHLEQLCANPARPRQPLLMRGLCMAIIDEADSTLLDEACTPLILSNSAQRGHSVVEFEECFRICADLWVNRDFTLNKNYRRAELTAKGKQRITEAVSNGTGCFQTIHPRQLQTLVKTALAARHLYQRDRDYLVQDGAVQIVDAVTGRVATGRVWSGGLQQMVELKEGLAPSQRTETVAQITYQQFFPRYLRLTGLSGSLREARSELAAVYALSISQVPLRKPLQRQHLPTRVFVSAIDKWRAVIEHAKLENTDKRPVLIGVESVEQSRLLSTMLQQAGLDHQVLNAADHAAEAAVIARAGLPGAITVATNMAGRGTDIKIHKAVGERGGLLLIACHYNTERRTDRQLAGRAGRRGQRGEVQRYASLQDELWSGIVARLNVFSDVPTGQAVAGLPALVARAIFVVSQRICETRQRRIRIQLLEAGLARDRLLAPSGLGE